MFDSFAQFYQSGHTQTDYASMTRTTVQTCVRALSRFFRVAQFAVTAVRPLRRKAVLITCLAIVEKDLHDTICAKPACDRVHPVAVVTASSRISQNSRAGWPTVLHQRAPPVRVRVVQIAMFIHPDDRPRRIAARCQSGGLDHTPVSRTDQMVS